MNDHLQALPAGHRLGEYRIERVLGSGGFGITYYAWDIHLDKPVAIKEYLPNEFALRTDATTVKPKSTADQENYQWGLERFLEEARTLARFKNPYLNEVHRLFEDNGTAYIVLEYIEGETLSQILRREGRLDTARLARLLEELLSGLEEVHKAGFVHRDIKPSNIMLRENGATVLLDFGAARQVVGRRSKSITSILTPGYAPIEQYSSKGEDIGSWTDLYALGMVAYRCISGSSDGELLDAVARARLERKGEKRKDLSPAVELGKSRYDNTLLKAVDWAIRVNEEQRPQNVAAMREALKKDSKAAPKTHRRSVRCDETNKVQLSLEKSPGGRYERKTKAYLVEAQNKHFAKIFGRDASPYENDEDGLTDLHYISAADMSELARFLLDAGANLHARMKNDGQPISETSIRKLRELARKSVWGNFDEDFMNFTREGETSLLFAVRPNAHKTAQLLISCGADIHAKDKDGSTLLHVAALHNAHETAQLLISHGADIHAKEKDGRTPLHAAPWSNAHETAQLLISCGADIHAKDKDGWTPLHLATSPYAHETALLLISRGADVQAKSKGGRTPLHHAAWGNAHETARLLISHGADIYAKDKDGVTPKDLAISQNHAKMARLLR